MFHPASVPVRLRWSFAASLLAHLLVLGLLAGAAARRPSPPVAAPAIKPEPAERAAETAAPLPGSLRLRWHLGELPVDTAPAPPPEPAPPVRLSLGERIGEALASGRPLRLPRRSMAPAAIYEIELFVPPPAPRTQRAVSRASEPPAGASSEPAPVAARPPEEPRTPASGAGEAAVAAEAPPVEQADDGKQTGAADASIRAGIPQPAAPEPAPASPAPLAEPAPQAGPEEQAGAPQIEARAQPGQASGDGEAAAEPPDTRGAPAARPDPAGAPPILPPIIEAPLDEAGGEGHGSEDGMPGMVAAPDRGPGVWTMDAREFFQALTDHLYRVNQAVLEALDYRGRRVTVDVRVIVGRDGRVLGARVLRSTGDPELDRAAEAVVIAASPLPRMSDDMPQQQLELVVPVEVYR